ncbi:hypothetical protein [Egbenema bharatensis]|uniref:hypothetical protein n=1 Tax=Egbenema bharatensis TaxID=3463334 RepID=UPI003A839C40
MKKFNVQMMKSAGLALFLVAPTVLGLKLPAIAQEPGFTPEPAAPTREITPAATEDLPAFERPGFIGACRATNRPVEVFADSSLSAVNRVGTFAARTPVTLTGVLREGRAQVYYRTSPTSDIRVVGWVNAAFLTGCDQLPPSETCFRVLPTNGLIAREAPNGQPQRTPGGSLDGPAGGSQVFSTSTPPNRQTVGSYVWMQVRYTSLTNTTRTGWIAERLVGGGSNLAPCN